MIPRWRSAAKMYWGTQYLSKSDVRCTVDGNNFTDKWVVVVIEVSVITCHHVGVEDMDQCLSLIKHWRPECLQSNLPTFYTLFTSLSSFQAKRKSNLAPVFVLDKCCLMSIRRECRARCLAYKCHMVKSNYPLRHTDVTVTPPLGFQYFYSWKNYLTGECNLQVCSYAGLISTLCSISAYRQQMYYLHMSISHLGPCVVGWTESESAGISARSETIDNEVSLSITQLYQR